MPVYTSGAPVHIQGGYNDVGRDMFKDNTTIRYENSNNVTSSTFAHSFNDSSVNKNSTNTGLGLDALTALRGATQQKQETPEEREEGVLREAHRILVEHKLRGGAMAESSRQPKNPFQQPAQQSTQPPVAQGRTDPFPPPSAASANPRNPFASPGTKEDPPPYMASNRFPSA